MCLLIGTSFTHAQGNLVVNGNFANGTSGWITNANSGYWDGLKGNPMTSPSFCLKSTISQNIGGLTPDISYTISGDFDLEGGYLSPTPAFGSFVNNSPVFETAANDYYWHTFSVTYTANSPNMLLSFSTLNGDSYRIDNISVEAIPEPESFTVIVAGLGIVGVILLFRRRHA